MADAARTAPASSNAFALRKFAAGNRRIPQQSAATVLGDLVKTIQRRGRPQ
jgi:hypothetical protein